MERINHHIFLLKQQRKHEHPGIDNLPLAGRPKHAALRPVPRAGGRHGGGFKIVHRISFTGIKSGFLLLYSWQHTLSFKGIEADSTPFFAPLFEAADTP